MECREVQELLSAYYDAEMPAELRSSVAEHVQACARCGGELALFGELSAMARGLDDPEPPETVWAGIEAGLNAGENAASAMRPAAGRGRAARKRRLGLLAAAALVMIAAGVVWMAGKTWHGMSPPGELAADFGRYFEQFPENPEAAQNILLAKYDGLAVDMSQATRQLGYRPAVAAGVPERYTVDAVYVLKMPCCTCVQAICRRDDGRRFAIFEHDEERPAWHGGRECISTHCRGCPCRLIQTGRGVVASWKGDKRHLTVVGARDLEDIADLVTHFQGGTPET